MKIETGLTDGAILAELGRRLERLRLSRNLTQAEVSEEAGVSKRTLERLETGRSVQLSNFIRLLRTLRIMEGLNLLIPEPQLSPIAQLELRGKVRRRASKKKELLIVSEKTWKWGSSECR